MVSLAVDETIPQMILIRVRETDGSDTALMMDGSVQGAPELCRWVLRGTV